MLVEGARRVEGFGDRVIGSVFSIAAIANIIGARSTIVMLPVLFVAVLVLAYVERVPLRTILKPVPEALPIALFLAFATLSAAWSADASATLASTSIAFLTLIAWSTVHRWLTVQPDRRIRHVAFWFVIAVVAGGAVILFELLSDQLIRRVIVRTFDLIPDMPGKHYRVNAAGNIRIPDWDLNRSIAVANMFLWPALLCIVSCWSRWKLKVIAVALVAITALLTVVSNHETSKLALVVGLACFAFCYLWRRLAHGVTVVLWTLLALGFVFAASFAYSSLSLHTAPWLQSTAQQRILIWNDVAHRVAEAPIIGSGVRSGLVLSDRSKIENTYNPVTKGGTTVPRHAHSVYLQNWFELGVIGAVLFFVAGLAILRALARLSEPAQPYALATFAIFMIEIFSSWEIWQGWFMALFAMTSIYLALAVRSAEPGGSRGESPRFGAQQSA